MRRDTPLSFSVAVDVAPGSPIRRSAFGEMRKSIPRRDPKTPRSRARDLELLLPRSGAPLRAPIAAVQRTRDDESSRRLPQPQDGRRRLGGGRSRDRESGHRAGSSCVQTEPPSTCARPGLVPAALLRSGARFPEMREASERPRPPNEYQVLHPGDPLASLCRPPVNRTPPGRQKDMSHPRLL